MPYPSKGAWTFRNIDRAFDFFPQLQSVHINQEQPTGLATFEARVVLTGPNAGAVFDTEDESEVTYRGGRIWAGHLKGTIEDQADEGAEAAYGISGQDYTAKLGDALIRRRRKRKRERVRRRVKWILSYLRPNIWTLAGKDLSNLPGSNPYVEAYDYYGSSVSEALEHVADELRLHFYIDLDNVFQMFRTDAVAAPFDLDNDAPDLVTTFPFRSWTHEKESLLGNAVLVEPEQRKLSRWTRDAGSIAAYGRQERFISDSNLGGKIAALNVGARAIAMGADPQEESRLVCWEPGLAPGQTIHVKEAVWSHDFDRIIESVEIRAVDPHDDAGEARLVSALVLTDKRRPRGRHKGGGATSGGLNKVIKGRPGATVDTGPYPLDSYARTVAPPTISDGAAVPSITLAGYIDIGRTHGEVGVDWGPTWHDGAYHPPGSYLGSWYNGHTSRPSWTTCAGLDNVFTGFKQQEVWYKVTVTAHPADAAGIEVAFHAGVAGGMSGPSYAEAQPLEVVVMSSQPTDMRQGTVIAELMPGQDQTVMVPMSVVPAEGAVLYMGYRTKWEANSKDDPTDYSCGWTWPFMGNAIDLDSEAVPYQGYSGRCGVTIPTGAIWQAWDSSAADMGSIPVGGKAPWEGGNTLIDAGSEGEGDAWGMDGDFFVSASSPSGKGIYVVGHREDDDEPDGPWSDVAWAHELHFTLDAHGSLSDAGTRSIESTTTGEGESAIGRVHLGDTSHAEGISVLGPTIEDYIAKALTLDVRWIAKFDTRSGRYVRGKLWKKSDGEPAQWDVQALLSETEDALDRWTLWLRAGNDASAQGVRVHKTRAFAGASAGQRLVKEWIGYASGTDKRFPTAHQYRENTLRAYVNGIGVAPDYQDGANATFGLDFWPTTRSAMRATYIVDLED